MGFRVSSERVQRRFQAQIPFSFYPDTPSGELLSRKVTSPSWSPDESGENSVHLVCEGNTTFL